MCSISKDLWSWNENVLLCWVILKSQNSFLLIATGNNILFHSTTIVKETTLYTHIRNCSKKKKKKNVELGLSRFFFLSSQINCLPPSMSIYFHSIVSIFKTPQFQFMWNWKAMTLPMSLIQKWLDQSINKQDFFNLFFMDL